MGTELSTVSCNNCGAALEVQPDTRFITCAYCGTRLAVRRTGTSAFTEILGDVRDHTRQIAEDVGVMRLHEELETIDREWSMRRTAFMSTDTSGQSHVPTRAAGVVGGLIMAGFGLFWTVTAAQMGAPSIFPVFGVIFILVGLFTAAKVVTNTGRYEEAERAYLQRRQAIVSQLDARRTSAASTAPADPLEVKERMG